MRNERKNAMLKSTASSFSDTQAFIYLKDEVARTESAQEAALSSDGRGEKKGRKSVESKREKENGTGRDALARLRRGEERKKERERVCVWEGVGG